MTTIIACAACPFIGAAVGVLLMALIVANRLGPRDRGSYGGMDDE